MTFIEKMKMQAKQDIKTIVLPESEDIRTLEATEIVLKEGFANIILIGNPQEINELAEKIKWSSNCKSCNFCRF